LKTFIHLLFCICRSIIFFSTNFLSKSFNNFFYRHKFQNRPASHFHLNSLSGISSDKIFFKTFGCFSSFDLLCFEIDFELFPPLHVRLKSPTLLHQSSLHVLGKLFAGSGLAGNDVTDQTFAGCRCRSHVQVAIKRNVSVNVLNPENNYLSLLLIKPYKHYTSSNSKVYLITILISSCPKTFKQTTFMRAV